MAGDNRITVFDPPAIERQEKRCLFTVAVGSKYQWMFDLTLPLMRQYAKDHGLGFVVIDDGWRTDEHPCKLKGAVRMLLEWFDRALYVDSDIAIRPGSPNLFDVVPPGKCGARNIIKPQEIRRLQTDYLEAYNEEMRRLELPEVEIPERYMERYYNAGMFVCDATCNPHVEPPGGVMRLPTSPHYDQNYFNLIVNTRDIPMHDLGEEWNFSLNHSRNRKPIEEYGHVHFFHYIGNGTKRKIQDHMEKITGMGRTRVKAEKAKEGSRLHIVISEGGAHWILGWMADRLQQHAPPEWEVTRSNSLVDDDGVVNFIVPYRSYGKRSVRAKDVPFFTHPEKPEQWAKAAGMCDHAIVMCDKYRRDLRDRGVDEARVTSILPGVDDRYRRSKVRIFNPSRMNVNNGYVQRKGVSDWRRLAALPYVEAVCTNGQMHPDKVLEMYEWADVIVSTAEMEGGPMAAVEAVAMGKPVCVREGVGLAGEVEGVTVYADYASLAARIRDMHRVRDQVKTWKQWAEEHYQVFAEVLRQPRREADPEHAAREAGRRVVSNMVRRRG